MTLDWDANFEPNLLGYDVFRDANPEGEFATKLNAAPITGVEWIDRDSGLTPGSSVFYRIVAVGAGGESPPSDTASATPGSARVSLSNVVAPPGGAASVQVVFENATGVSGSGVSFDIAYDPTLLTPTRVSRTGLTSDFDFTSNVGSANGRLEIDGSALAPSGQGGPPSEVVGEGGFVNVEFAVSPEATVGQSAEMQLVEAVVVGVGETPVPVAIDLGDPAQTAIDTAFVRGDATGDGLVDATDARNVLLAAVGLRTPASQEEIDASDLNRDGRVDAADATLVLRAAAGLPTDPEAPAGTAPSRIAGNDIVVELVAEAATCDGDTVTIPLMMSPPIAFASAGLSVTSEANEVSFEGATNALADDGFLMESALTTVSGIQTTNLSLAAASSPESPDGSLVLLRFTIANPGLERTRINVPFARLAGEFGENLAWRNAVTNLGATLSTGLLCSDSRLTNLSTRSRVGTGDEVLIAGIIVEGDGPRLVLLTGVGPTLAAQGVEEPLSDPTLALFDADFATLQANDDWVDSPFAAEIASTGRAPGDASEAAILISLAPGRYTAVLRGENLAEGVGLVQAFDLSEGRASRFDNLSTRGFAGAGDDRMIAGFRLSGTGPRRVLARAVGPSLTAAGIEGALANPNLAILGSGGGIVVANGDWTDAGNAAEIAATGLAPLDPLESAVLLELPPGDYTAVVEGDAGGTGNALVEIYEIE